jgi:hypothetical protein
MGTVSAVFSLVCAYYAFKSNIDLQSENAVDRNNPFSTPFTLSNEGWFPVTNVICTFGLIRAEYEPKIEFKNVSMAPYAQIDTLNSGHKTTIFMSDYLRDTHNGIRVQHQLEGMEVACSVTIKYLLAMEKKVFWFRCI